MVKFNWTYIAFLAAAFIFDYMEGGSLPSSIFYCLVFFFAAGAFDIMLHTRGISVSINFDKHIYETRDSAQFSIIVENNTILPAAMAVVKNGAYSHFSPNYNGHAFSLRAFESKCLKLNVNFLRRGIYNFGNSSLSIKDFFSIFEKNININKETLIKIYPKTYKLKNIVTLGNESFETLSNKRGNVEDMSTVDDIRKYRIGDSLKRIHWKVSAKHGELYTKNFDIVCGEECNLLLDMNRSGYFIDNAELIEEQLIELFCSVTEHMRQKEIKSSIYISSDKTKRFEVKSCDDMDTLREFFLCNYSVGDSSFAKFIENSSHEIERAGWLGVFVPRVTGRIKEMIHALKYEGYNITIFYVSNDAENMKYVQELKSYGIETLSFNEVV